MFEDTTDDVKRGVKRAIEPTSVLMLVGGIAGAMLGVMAMSKMLGDKKLMNLGGK